LSKKRWVGCASYARPPYWDPSLTHARGSLWPPNTAGQKLEMLRLLRKGVTDCSARGAIPGGCGLLPAGAARGGHGTVARCVCRTVRAAAKFSWRADCQPQPGHAKGRDMVVAYAPRLGGWAKVPGLNTPVSRQRAPAAATTARRVARPKSCSHCGTEPWDALRSANYLIERIGVPYRIRTGVAAVRERLLTPLGRRTSLFRS